MYCYNCGKEIDSKAVVCVYCGVMVSALPRTPKFYTGGFILGILSICIPFYGFILGVIGLPLACISKRKSSIIMNSIGIALWVLLFILYIVLLTFLISQEVNYKWGIEGIYNGI